MGNFRNLWIPIPTLNQKIWNYNSYRGVIVPDRDPNPDLELMWSIVPIPIPNLAKNGIITPLQSASIAQSQGLLDSFCQSSPGRWAILQLLCSQARRKLLEELTQELSSKPCDRAIDALCTHSLFWHSDFIYFSLNPGTTFSKLNQESPHARL